MILGKISQLAVVFANKPNRFMLSVLIPVFNFDIRPLVHQLHQQCQAANIPFEIIGLDDGSQPVFRGKNKAISDLAGVRYVELGENIGRSRIRNRLGEMAQYDQLLFMDCDSKIVRSNFIARYLEALEDQTVLCGGVEYSSQPPKKIDHYFHWFYGSRREQRTARERNQAPYHSFMTGQFVVPKKLFLDIRFEESLREYGHEDTLFGLELKKRQINIRHLDNPMQHLGLEETKVFLEKSKQAIENLGHISKQNLGIETKLLRTYHKVSNLGLSHPIGRIGSISEAALLKNFHSSRPNLHFFDLYKLTHLIRVMENN